MSSSLGNKIKVQLFGQSHGEVIGVVVDGLPAGVKLDLIGIQAFLERRAPGRDPLSTSRREADIPHILSGVVDGLTCGAPLCAIFENGDTHSVDYLNTGAVPRPSHSDYTAHIKHHGFSDMRGGGHFSGRLTSALCFAGAICIQLLGERNIFIGSHICSVGGVSDERFAFERITREQLFAPQNKSFPCICDSLGEKMQAEIAAAKDAGDSVGGTVECAILGLPAGLGEPMFDTLEGLLAKDLFGIPAVKGVDFGSGFEGSTLRGSRNNDPFCIENGSISIKNNRAGGILGGISTGMPVVFRVAFKPTPSISLAQQSVNLDTNTPAELATRGRHDPCIVKRALPCVESVAAITVLNLLAL